MELKKIAFNKLFISGIICGVFIAACFVWGIQYGKSLALTSKDHTKIDSPTLALVERCLSLKGLLNQVFDKSLAQPNLNELEVNNKASFYYQNFDNSFKGICSNAQFHLESNEIKNTTEKQRYVFLWSSELGAEDPKLSLDNIEYTLVKPENIEAWLQKAI